jgi:hypothetical protein
MIFMEIFFCLSCNFHRSKPTRTQNREKQRNILSFINFQKKQYRIIL